MSTTSWQSAIVDSGEAHSFNFAGKVTSAATVVQGFDIKEFGDNHVEDLKIDTAVSSISAGTVTVTATCKIADDSGHVQYGKVTVLCIVGLE